MADPEAIYQEVLQEEQEKGSSPAVKEGRAKAARQRAVEGSPHPKEAKWWPGSQPQFEGDGAAPSESSEEAPEEEEAPAEQPEAEQPAAEAPAEQPAAQAPEQPAAQAPEQPAAQAPEQPAAQAPEQPAAQGGVAVAEAPPRQETLGVSHGTPSGNRLRPEDSVATEGQFAAQQAVYERRKLIDDLVSTGVPQVSASDTERRGSGFLALLYVAIPLIAVILLVGSGGGTSSAPAGEEPTQEQGGGGGGQGDVQLSAQDLAFDTDTIELAAAEPQVIAFDNPDSAEHNLAIYKNEKAGQAQKGALFSGENVASGGSTEYKVDPLKKGSYYFQCDIHPTMNGDVEAT